MGEETPASKVVINIKNFVKENLESIKFNNV